jgi:hypothetical protein
VYVRHALTCHKGHGCVQIEFTNAVDRFNDLNECQDVFQEHNAAAQAAAVAGAAAPAVTITAPEAAAPAVTRLSEPSGNRKRAHQGTGTAMAGSSRVCSLVGFCTGE